MISFLFKNALWLIAIGLISCDKPLKEFNNDDFHELNFDRKVSISKRALKGVGHLNFCDNKIVGFDYSSNELIIISNLNGVSNIDKAPVLFQKKDQKVIECHVTDSIVTLHLLDIVTQNDKKVQVHSILQQNIQGSRLYFYKELKPSTILQPGFYLYPPVENDQSFSVRGHINGDWGNYFENKMELKFFKQKDSIANTFPTFSDENLDGYGSYARDFVGRCVLQDSLYIYSIPVKNNLYVYSEKGNFIKELPLGDVDVNHFKKLEQKEDFSLMMKNISSKPYFASFGQINNTFIYRVFEHRQEVGIKTNDRSTRDWTLYIHDVDFGKNSTFKFQNDKYSPIVSSNSKLLVFTENTTTNDSLRTFWYYDILRKSSK
jgi:hypothetical protein